MKLAKTFLAIGIAIILALFIGYSVEVIYETPDYEDYVNESLESPVFIGEDREYKEDPALIEKREVQQKEYREVIDKYNSNLFIILTIIGGIVIIIGMCLMKLESIGSGILGGGILTIFYGVLRSWGVLNKYLRLGILFIVLVLLIWLGYKKIEKKMK